MKLSQAKEFLPLIQAWADGETIQFRCNNSDGSYGPWMDYKDSSTINWSDPVDEYRIKPTPTLRAWKPEEVPVGVLIRKDGLYPQVILGCDDIRVQCVWWEIFYENLKHCEHSTDGGKTWKECGVLE